LFQWVRDGRVVYGFEGEVVVKVAV
jgi:hypothetical protein